MSGQNHVDNIIIGAGPGGLQLAYCLDQAGMDYLILEAGETAGTFWRRFPRHRTLISVNKRYTGGAEGEVKLRYDWNSLLSDNEALQFTRYSERYLPHADDMVRYLTDFANQSDLKIRYETEVCSVDKKEDRFQVRDEGGNLYTCRRLIVATGLSKPYVPPIPGIEHAENYRDFSIEPAEFTDQRVLILGKGNSAFETADNLIETAATIHVCSPEPLRMAWQSHYVGHLRAANNNLLDTYQLKLQNAALDATVTKIEREEDGVRVSFAYSHAKGDRTTIYYDRVLVCTGFGFDDSIFAPNARPALTHGGKFPAQTSEWESTNVPGMYFVGNLMHSRDYRKTMSGFIHGFRHNAVFLASLLHKKETGAPLPSWEVGTDPAGVCDLILDRLNNSACLGLQPGFFCDVLTVPEDGGAPRYCKDVPFDYAFDSELSAGRWYSVTLEFGEANGSTDPFNINRDPDPAQANTTPFLHPVIRGFRGATRVSELHLIEDLENHFTVEKHYDPLLRYFAEELARHPVGAAQ